ncbi:MAG: hypothetical protein RSC08_00480 [Oscillospiraceae bacterium]
MNRKKFSRRILCLLPLGILLFLVVLMFVLQTVVAHQFQAFVPPYAQTDLQEVWDRQVLTEEDYSLFFRQTGLGKPAVDDLRVKGDVGYRWLLDIQTSFFAPREVLCRPLGFITQEERLTDENGALTYGATLAPLQNGDILLSFSTHTYGWRHGHAGLVVDAAQGVTLEAAVWGEHSGKASADFWRTYSTVLVLRPKGMTPELRAEVTAFALDALDDVPYHLTSGVFGDKAPEEDVVAQCSYLVWYAYQHFGLDLDSDGGRIVTVNDLAESDLLEVVQVYGLDPSAFPVSHKD